MTSVAYAPPTETLAMIVMQTCSLIENGPGLRENTYPKMEILRVGRIRSRALPNGRDISWITIPVMITDGTDKFCQEDGSYIE